MEERIRKLKQSVHALLTTHTGNVSEHELLLELQENGALPDKKDLFSSTITLFQSHFLLFHCLYQLDEDLVSEGKGGVHIDAMKIGLLPADGKGSRLGKPDALRSYYLDFDNFRNTSSEDVDDLLNSFWEGYLRNEGRQDALETLGLIDPVNDDQITTAYRRLAARHHPDRGGDHQQIQSINHAYHTLIKHSR